MDMIRASVLKLNQWAWEWMCECFSAILDISRLEFSYIKKAI